MTFTLLVSIFVCLLINKINTISLGANIFYSELENFLERPKIVVALQSNAHIGRFLSAEKSEISTFTTNTDVDTQEAFSITFEDDNNIVTIKSLYTGRYLSSPKADHEPIKSDSLTSRDTKQQFQLVQISANEVAFKALGNNKFLGVKTSGGAIKLLANSSTCSSSEEIFQIFKIDENQLKKLGNKLEMKDLFTRLKMGFKIPIAIKETSINTFWSVENSGLPLNVDTKELNVRRNEWFEVERAETGPGAIKISIRSLKTNQYVSTGINGNLALTSSSGTFGRGEIFLLSRKLPGLKTDLRLASVVNSKFVTTIASGNLHRLIASEPSDGLYSKFEIYELVPATSK